MDVINNYLDWFRATLMPYDKAAIIGLIVVLIVAFAFLCYRARKGKTLKVVLTIVIILWAISLFYFASWFYASLHINTMFTGVI